MENMHTDVMVKMVLIVYIILNQHTALQLAHLMMYFYHHHKKDFFSGLPIPGHCSDEGLMHETSAFKLFTEASLCFQRS